MKNLLSHDEEIKNKTITIKEFRLYAFKFAAAAALSFLLLAFGGIWAVQSAVNKSRDDLVNNVVILCERGIPLRELTNKNSKAVKLVSINTAQLLESSIKKQEAAGVDPAELKEVKILASRFRNVAETAVQIPVPDCNNYRKVLTGKK